jgi:hypothetical protein
MNNSSSPPWVTDIDDTIADTALALTSQILREFPRSTTQSALELITTYNQPGNVPSWQTPSIQARIAHYFNHPALVLSIPPIPHAASIMKKITPHTPLAFYLTSRPPALHQITLRWLKKYHFPPAPLITRSPEVLEIDWKFHYLSRHLPYFSYFIEDNYEAITQPAPHLLGQIILFDRHQQHPTSTLPPKVIKVQNWPDIARIFPHP